MDTNKKILIIDDEVDLAQMLGFQFKAKGFEVQTASDGLAGLESVHQFKPDLIILDINMPRMGGIEFYSKICGTNGQAALSGIGVNGPCQYPGTFSRLADRRVYDKTF